MSNEWMLPKPIRYENYQLKSGSYVVAGAVLTCTKMKNKNKKVELAALYRGANTGYDIKAFDVDRKEENFCIDFGICTKTTEECVLTSMAARWLDPNKSLGFVEVNFFDVIKKETYFSTMRPPPKTSKIYPLSMESRLYCNHGDGWISIKENGQKQKLAKGKFDENGNWVHKYSWQKDTHKLPPNPKSYFQPLFSPLYEPRRWNNSSVGNANCYSYAINMPFDPMTGKDWPVGGFQISKYSDPSNFNSTQNQLIFLKSIIAGDEAGDTLIVNSIKNDLSMLGLEFLEYKSGLNGGYRVDLYTSFELNSYHFFVENPDGTWSHKPGQTEATNFDYYYDDNGTMIYDKRIHDTSVSAEKMKYEHFVGSFYVKEK